MAGAVTISNIKKALAEWTRKSLHSVSSAHKEYLFTGACLECLFSFRIHPCPNDLYLLPCLPLYSSSQRQIWAVFHNPIAENSMSSGYAQPNDAMHSCPTSHMEKKSLSQIVTFETRMMQSNNYTKKAIC